MQQNQAPQHHVTRIAQALDARVNPHHSLMNNTAPDRLSNYVHLLSGLTKKDKNGKTISPYGMSPYGMAGLVGLPPGLGGIPPGLGGIPPGLGGIPPGAPTSGLLPSHVISPDLIAPPPIPGMYPGMMMPGMAPGMMAPGILPGIGSHPQMSMATGMGSLSGMPPVTGVPVKHTGTPHNDGYHHHPNAWGGLEYPHEHSEASHA